MAQHRVAGAPKAAWHPAPVTAGSEGSARRLVRNTVANAGGRLVNVALAIALTPFLLNRLGPAEYGVWLLAATLTFSSGYLNLAELGLQQAAVRLVAEARSRGDDREASEVVSTATALYAVVGVVLAAALVVGAGVLAQVFDVPEDLEHVATLVFLLVGLQIAVDLPAAGVLAFLEGSQRYGLFRAFDVGARTLWAAGTVVAVRRGHGVVALGVVSLAVAVLTLLVALAVVARDPGVRLRPGLVSRASVRRLSGQGAPMLGLRVLGVIYSQMDRAIIGVALGTAAVARYEIAYKLHATAALTLGVAPSAVMPATAYLGSAGQPERLRRLFLRGTKYAVAGGLPIAVGAMLFAGPLIRTWVGAEYTDIADEARVFLAYPALAIFLVIGQTMLTGLGRMRDMLLYHVVAVALNLVLSLVLVDRLGIGGVIWGTLAAYLVLWVPFHILFFREFGVSTGEWVREVALPNLPGLAVQLAIGLAVLAWVDDFDQLWQVATVFLANVGVAVAVFLYGVLGTEERAGLIGALRRSPVAAAP